MKTVYIATYLIKSLTKTSAVDLALVFYLCIVSLTERRCIVMDELDRQTHAHAAFYS